MIRVINFVDFSTARHSSNEFGSVQALNEKFVFVNLNSQILKFLTMIKVNWTKVAKVLKLVATVITSVLGTLAVQSCMGI